MIKVMGKRPRRKYLEVNRDQFVKNVQNMASWDWYKYSHKQATLMWQESKKAKISGVVTPKPLTIRHIVSNANLTQLMHPIYYEVKNVTVRKYFYLGKAGESPEKRGRPPRITDALLEASNLHVTRIQASGDIVKADESIMMAIIDDMVHGTGFEGSFTTYWCWLIVRNPYTDTLVHTEMFDHEDRREEWLTFKNIDQWIGDAK